MNPNGTLLLLSLALALLFTIALGSSCPFSTADDHHHQHLADKDDLHSHSSQHHHQHQHHHHPHHHDHHHHPETHHHDHSSDPEHHAHTLAEEIAEEEELKLYGFKSHTLWEEQHPRERSLSPIGLWLRALGCSLLVSMASLICLILLPLIVAKGKPSRIVVDSLAAFGAGAMLGDAFLHQLPHALGGTGGHAHVHGADHGHMHDHHHHSYSDSTGNSGGQPHTVGGGHAHAHSIQDLSVGLAVLAGIILFFIVEKIVRQVEKSSSNGTLPWAHHHHHHHHHHGHHHNTKHPDEDDEATELSKQEDILKDTDSKEEANGPIEAEKTSPQESLRKRVKKVENKEDTIQEMRPLLSEKDDSHEKPASASNKQALAPNLVLGYLNLFSDGVHNFTDGMALGSAFLNHGAIGGWSRTLFLLAHELPQEVGDFGILVQSGFSVPKALAFNFLSALAALAGTALALLLGGSAGHSALIEGFTAGGFIYIAVAGVLPEMHQQGTSTSTTLLQLMALGFGMSIALIISLME